jgi:gamma-glutamyltranspeptidase/glutathione hydrolase
VFHTNHFPRSFYPHHAAPGVVVVDDRPRRRWWWSWAGAGTTSGSSPGWSQGRLSGVATAPAAGQLRAAANPRGMQGYAVGRCSSPEGEARAGRSNGDRPGLAYQPPENPATSCG